MVDVIGNKYSSLLFLVLLIFWTTQVSVEYGYIKPCIASLQTISRVERCPEDYRQRRIAVERKNCSSLQVNNTRCETLEYHCVLSEDLKYAIEVCASSILTEEKSCVVFSNQYHSLMEIGNITNGNGAEGCSSLCLSSIPTGYKGCFKKHMDRGCYLIDPLCVNAVDGGWSPFSYVWTPCTVTCGGGIQSGQHRRTCTNPPPSDRGKPCEGSSYGRRASRSCNSQSCPVDGHWSEFGTYSEWDTCSVTCGTGIQRRVKTRICNNPKPQHGGKNCIGTNITFNTKYCDRNPCQVDGNWSEFLPYGDWSQCTVSCGNGTETRVRFRTCSQPAPLYGGKPCEGPSTKTESKQCMRPACPVSGGWSLFGPFSEWTQCTSSCGAGSQERTRRRTCNHPAPQHGGRDCVGLNIFTEKRTCNIQQCPVPGDWSEWNECPVTCGGGVQQRIRTKACNKTDLNNKENHCTGSKEERRCNIHICPVHGQWSLFFQLGDWTQCSSSCNNGTRTRVRIRTCSEPAPLYGGRPCVGQSMSTESMTCNTQPCSVPGGWSQYGPYSEWTQCSLTCEGFQERTRFRNCNNPTPQHGGKDCVGLRISREERKCNTKSCAGFDGQWSLFIPFGDWSQCSLSCNNGTKTRVRIRTCSEPAPSNGGKPCVGQRMSTELQTCNTQPCNGKQYLTQTTISIVALVSSILILLGGLLLFYYCRYKGRSKRRSVPQPQPEIYEEIHSMDIMNNIYVPSYAEYILNPQLMNRPNLGTARPTLFMNIQRFGSTMTYNTNDCRLSEIIRLGGNDEANKETIFNLSNFLEPSGQDESKLAVCSQNAFGEKNDDQEEYFDVANSKKEEFPIEVYEKPMIKSRNSYITVLPDIEEIAIKDQQDYLDCCHDFDELEETKEF